MLKENQRIQFEFIHYCLSMEKLDLAKVKNINDNDNTALHYAAKCGNIVLAKMLLSAKANINVRNSDGKTPLMFACQYKKSRHVKFVRFLLSLSLQGRGKNHDSITSNNSNDSNDDDTICYCDVDCVDDQGDSALSHAIRSSNVKAVKMLLAYYMRRNTTSSYIAKFELLSSSSEASIVNTKNYIHNQDDTVAAVAASTILARQIREEKTGIKFEKDFVYKKKNLFLYYCSKSCSYCFSSCCCGYNTKLKKIHSSSCVIVNMIDDAMCKWNDDHNDNYNSVNNGDDQSNLNERKKVKYYIYALRKRLSCACFRSGISIMKDKKKR